VDAGFLEETRHGDLIRKTRIASEWRLTAYKCDLTGSLSNNAFMTRGTLVNENRQHKSRPQTSRAGTARPSQTEPSQTHSPGLNDGSPWPKRRPTPAQNRASQLSEWPKIGPVGGVFEPSPGLNDGPHIINQGIPFLEHGAAEPEPSLCAAVSTPDRGFER
jgi:hypothetical protein